jgi:hypothetical protein
MIPLSWDGPVAFIGGVRRRVAECASCELERPLYCRGLCRECHARHLADGTLDSFGYVKADRVSDYAALRAARVPIVTAAARLGVARRTAHRYETELAAAGKAPWRRATGNRADLGHARRAA